ncbi:MAG: ABC transporter permease [Deltaproteobacteria bacterium]
MTALQTKLFRDLWHMRGQAAAISLVMACGVATFVMSLCTLASLQRSQETYYERAQFADVFTHLKRAPRPLAGRIAEIPGVARVETRIVERATLDMPDLAEPAAGRLISVPERGSSMLNRLHLQKGRLVEPRGSGEAVVSAGFAEAHRLEPGDRVAAVINGRRQSLHIVGIALSPEYIYQIREGDVLPDDRRFGVFWMGYDELAAAFNMEGAFNDVCLALMPGASEPEVLQRLDRLTADYGGQGAYGRADQVSHKFVSNELQELRGMALVVPTIFLCVASFLLNVVISRQIGTQREQIAALKAFGYTRAEIALHYVQLVLVFVVVGVALGTGVGTWLGRGVTQIYVRFFRFPVFGFHLDPLVVLQAALVSAGAALVGTAGAVLRGVRLPPAEAMRPESPKAYRPIFLERIGLARLMSPSARMILRQMARQPWRVATSILGVSLSVGVLILGGFMLDALNYVLESEFEVAQRQDITVMFVEPTEGQALFDIRHLPGVRSCEAFRSLAVRLKSDYRSRRLGIVGFEPQGRLFRLIDIKRRVIPLPPDGLVLSTKLAELLGVAPGDFVTVEVLEGLRPVEKMQVKGVVSDFQGTAAYMNIDAMRRLMHEGDAISGAYITADANAIDHLYARLKEAPRVAGVTVKGAALRSFQQTIAENLLRMRTFNIIFASIIAFGVVYNNARISLSERSRDLATLRVIGFTTGEISTILLGEQALLTVAAVPVGMLAGYGLAALVINLAYDTELFRIPLIVDRWTYAFATAVTLAAALASGLVVRRRLYRLDLVAVLKARE